MARKAEEKLARFEILAIALFLGLLTLGIAYVAWNVTRQVEGGQPPCEVVKRPGGGVVPSPVGRPIVLAPVSGDRALRVSFREHRDPRRTKVVFDASQPLTGRAKQITATIRGDLLRVSDDDRFPREQIRTRAVVSSNGRHVTVRVCFDPARGRAVEPGRYEGTLLVEGPRITTASVPVEVSLRERRWPLVLVWALLAASAGVFVKLFVDLVNINTPPEGTTTPEPSTKAQWRAIIRQTAEPATVLSMMVGIVAALGAFFVLYLASETFGATSADWFKLGAFCFGATVGGMTITDLGKQLPKLKT